MSEQEVDWKAKYEELLAQRDQWWESVAQQRGEAERLAQWLLAEAHWSQGELMRALTHADVARQQLLEERNKIARQAADVRDDLDTARQEIQRVKEMYEDCSGDRLELDEKIYELEDKLKFLKQVSKERDDLFELLGAIWLYVNWKSVTKQLTTEQRNLWADAVDATVADRDDESPTADRWWQHD